MPSEDKLSDHRGSLLSAALAEDGVTWSRIQIAEEL